MKKLIWRNVVLPLMLFMVGFILFSLIQNSSISENKSILNYSPKELKAILATTENLNTERISRIERVCTKYNLGLYKTNVNTSVSFKYPPTPQYSVFYFDQPNKLAYCPIYKAGSTTWLYNLCILNGEKEEDLKGKQINEVARKILPSLDGEDAETLFRKTKLFICVRHPFDRIISAYRDKLEYKDRAPEHGTLHYYKRWGSKIRKKYRKDGQLEPTFEEFVRYLIDTDLLSYADDHWIPYNAYCTPCLLRYDYIATVETLTDDQLFFINSLSLSDWLSPTRRHSSKKISSLVAKEYFSQLTENQVNRLYDKLRLDFEMFDYSIHPYLGYAKESNM